MINHRDNMDQGTTLLHPKGTTRAPSEILNKS